MLEQIKILIVEDDPDDVELLVRELYRAGFDPHWLRVETEADYLANLSPDLDLILSGCKMPQLDGLRALELLKQHGLEVPFIIISDTIGEEIAVTTMQHGAAVYLLKYQITRLGPAVRRAMGKSKERLEHKRQEQQLIETQKMEAIRWLVTDVAHDFNNILGVIIGYSDLVKSELKPASPAQKYVEEIRHAAERANVLSQKLLILGCKQSKNAQAWDWQACNPPSNNLAEKSALG